MPSRFVYELLSDVMIDDSPGYATIRVHSLGFYQLVYRLVATGQKVATVARSVNAHGKVSYRLSEKFGTDWLAAALMPTGISSSPATMTATTTPAIGPTSRSMTALSIPDFKILLKTTTVGMVILRATKSECNRD